MTDIVNRFISYTKINTTTNRENGLAGIMPSNPTEYELALKLKGELEALNLKDIQLTDKAILTATLPSNSSKKSKVVSFFAHLDTSAEQSNDTNAIIQKYEGGDICLNKEKNIVLKQSEFPELANYIGQEIITTDGTSLLGADDKAAIAAIINAVKYYQENPEIEHGEVKIAFVPDEEQGLRGAKAFDVENFGADFAYTLDCCGIGDFVCENWNAGDAIVTFTGQSAHPMSAKGKLKNSLLMAHKFISMLPAGEAPQYTENREGYFWVKQLRGNSAETILNLDIRDFYKDSYQNRMDFLATLAKNCEELWGEGSVHIKLTKRYENVANSLEGANHYPVEIALAAYNKNNIKPNITPMRGGYDGAVLSQKGLPCPNVFTGGHNFHSIYEYLPVDSLKAASQVVKDIILLTHEKTQG